jgi:hypothetical protein
MHYLLYVFFWVIPRRLNFVRRRFETLCLFHLHRQALHLPAYEDGTDRVVQNFGIQNSEAGELPRRKHTTFTTWRKFEIKRCTISHIYFGKELYTFRRDLLSIIRSLNTVYTAIGNCHASYADCLLARSGWNSQHD